MKPLHYENGVWVCVWLSLSDFSHVTLHYIDIDITKMKGVDLMKTPLREKKCLNMKFYFCSKSSKPSNLILLVF